jgi:hypothetical protein
MEAQNTYFIFVFEDFSVSSGVFLIMAEGNLKKSSEDLLKSLNTEQKIYIVSLVSIK